MSRVLGLLIALSGCAKDGVVPGDTDTDGHSDVDGDVDSDTDVDTDTGGTVDTDTTDPCLTGEPVLRIGKGYLAYEPVEPGSELFMVHGPQGGWHVEVAFELEDVPQFVVLEWRAVLRGTTIDITQNGEGQPVDDPVRKRVALVPEVQGPWACRGTWPGDRNVFDFATLHDVPPDAPWQALCGQEITLLAAVREPGSGATFGPVLAEATLDVTLQPDPIDGEPCREAPAP